MASAALLASLVLSWAPLRAQPAVAPALAFTEVAPGLDFASSHDSALVGDAGPVAVHVLRADLGRVRLALALATGTSPGLERVADLAARTGAIAAINAGFFLPGGWPAGVMRQDGIVRGLGASARGALGIVEGATRQVLLMDRVRAFWIPWSQAGPAWPAAWVAPMGASALDEWQRAGDVIGGAGLLLTRGRRVTDWAPERLRDGFTTERHPRTMIGTDADGRAWLFAIDGRQPNHSIGMTFDDLANLATAAGLQDALNLDGGGSTTMVIDGRIVNRPSDLIGPRPVSDAIVVRAR